MNILNGEGHSNNVSGLSTSTDGKVYSIAFDDYLREIEGDGSGFVCVNSFVICSFVLTKLSHPFFKNRSASSRTTSQPKSIAVTGDLTVFISEIDTMEAFRSNQKVFELKPQYQLGAIAAHGSVVAIGEVSGIFLLLFN